MIPKASAMPVAMSTSGTPIRSGPPPRSPLTLISPACACTIAS